MVLVSFDSFLLPFDKLPVKSYIPMHYKDS